MQGKCIYARQAAQDGQSISHVSTTSERCDDTVSQQKEHEARGRNFAHQAVTVVHDFHVTDRVLRH